MRYRCGKDTAFDFFGNTAFDKAEFRELDALSNYLDVCPNAFTLIRLPVVLLSLKLWVSRLFTLLYTPKEVLKSGIKVTNR